MVLNAVCGLPHFKRLLSKVLNYNYVAASLQFSPLDISNKLLPSLVC